MDVNMHDEVDAPHVETGGAEADTMHAGMALAGRDALAAADPIDVPAGAYSEAGAQALVDALLVHVNTLVSAYNDLLTRIRQN